MLELDLQLAGGGAHGRGEVDSDAGGRRWLSLPMDVDNGIRRLRWWVRMRADKASVEKRKNGNKK
jgi:hypothetical protein